METMKILFLGYADSPLINYLRSLGDEVLVTSDKINPAFIKENDIEFIVSYGYRHIIKSDVIKALPDKIINLHIALLPWNRGADPNFWSFAENTPKGVTIHYIDTGIDTGDIITQKEVNFTNNDETLKSVYEHLQKEIQELFISYWPQIRIQKCSRHKQIGLGSVHFLKDREKFLHLLTAGWDTPIADIKGVFTLLSSR